MREENVMLWALPALALAVDLPPATAAGAPGAPAAEAPATTALADVRALEWQRADPSAFEKFSADADPEVRRAAAVGLGRLRSGAALGLLDSLAADGDPTVAAAAREALGYTPGSAATLRKLLDAEPSAAAWGVPAAAAGDRRAVLLRALGRQGESSDLPRLIAAIGEPGAAGAAAADAIARFARRKVDSGTSAVPALVDCLVRIDPAVVDSCAHALRRADLSKADHATLDELDDRWAHLPTGTARAWALRAAITRMEPAERTAALTVALTDPDALVRIAALDAAGVGDLPFTALVEQYADPRADVAAAALAAIGRTGGDNGKVFLDTAIHGKSAWEAAEAVEARLAGGGSIDPALATDPKLGAPARAAAAEGLTEPNVLLPLLDDPAAIVRSGAATRLAELGTAVDPTVAVSLLSNPDPVVRQAAIEVLAQHEARTGATPAPFVAPLVAQLRVDTDPDALVAGFDLLAERVRKRPKDIDANDNVLKSGIARGLTHADLPVREAAQRLATEARYTASPGERRQDFPLPDPALVSKIRSARVITDHGEFRMDLWPDVAPVAVWNFARLAEAGTFDGIVFHRVVPGFVVQTGDPRGDGNGGPGYTIPDEVSDVPFATGGVGMARSTPFDTGGSQWFVTTSPQPALVGDYTEFGRVTDGMHVVKAIRRGDVVKDVIIERVQ